MSALKSFTDGVFHRFPPSITDQVFLLIQNDRELMHDYLRLVEAQGLDVVNRYIGKAVKQHFGMENAPERGESPNSTLIRSFQIFEE